MKKILHWLKMVYFTMMFLSAALAFAAATYAWFTANEQVETSRITAETGKQDLELQISRSNFNPAPNQEVELKAPANLLMPVSTADLNTFVYNPVTNGDIADRFLPADETLYYHDTVYLRAKGTEVSKDIRLELYLDDKVDITQSISGELLTAARLGLRLTDEAGSSTFRILTLSDENEGSGNTRLNGEDVAPGNVLTLSGDTPIAVADPAIPIANVMAQATRTPIATMEQDKVYRVDIYFYLEGCDPDCTDEKVGLDRAALQLGFYGKPVWKEA